MQTKLASVYQDKPMALQAQDLLRRCVHCGFCAPACPTYELTGNELDGPRGRIYLIKQMLEGQETTKQSQLHLDQCLTCRGCEAACPSGVEFGRLIEIGRVLMDERVPRSASDLRKRKLLAVGLTSTLTKPFIGPAVRVGQLFRSVIPGRLTAHVPLRHQMGPKPKKILGKPRAKVLMLAGCVEPGLMPSIGRATERVLSAADIQIIYARGQGCCGAMRQHLADPEGAKVQMRANLDAWRPYLVHGEIDAIISDASGCALMLKEYGQLLADDPPKYSKLAQQASALSRDLSEMLPVLVKALRGRLTPHISALAYHAPCTLQHGQGLVDQVEKYLPQLGFTLLPPNDQAQMCCGAGGANVVLQPAIAQQLRDRKIQAFTNPDTGPPPFIISSNIGCIMHLQSGTEVPVLHWIELLDQALND